MEQMDFFAYRFDCWPIEYVNKGLLIGSDDQIDGKKNFLSLYNAIHGTNLTLENTRLERKRIPQSLYKTFDNDISVLVNGRLFVLIEHQSTPNENIRRFASFC